MNNKKYKKLITVLSVTLLLLCLTSCKQNVGTSEDNPVIFTEEKELDSPEYKFAFCGVDLNNPYFDTLYAVISETLEWDKHTIILKDPAGDASLQSQQLFELLEYDIDAVFIAPVEWDSILSAIIELRENGVKIINVDTQIKDSECRDAFIGSDNIQAGVMCGDVLNETFPTGAKLIIVEEPNLNSSNDRVTGFEETISNKGFDIQARINGASSPQITYDSMVKALTENPTTEVVMCSNDYMALGALKAINELGLDIKLITIDGSPDIKLQIELGNESILGTVAQSPITIGKIASEVALNILNKQEYQHTNKVDTFFIDRDNVEIYGTESWQ